jgi:hypothetical protein
LIDDPDQPTHSVVDNAHNVLAFLAAQQIVRSQPDPFILGDKISCLAS